jgi:hypothetical protein
VTPKLSSTAMVDASRRPRAPTRPKTAAMTDDVSRVATLMVPCLFGLWTAVACRRAQYNGLPGSDALVWAGLSGVFFLLSLIKTARGLGLLHGFGDFLRGIFKQRGWYETAEACRLRQEACCARRYASQAQSRRRRPVMPPPVIGRPPCSRPIARNTAGRCGPRDRGRRVHGRFHATKCVRADASVSRRPPWRGRVRRMNEAEARRGPTHGCELRAAAGAARKAD